ncbi:MAG: CBS domain-containing protein [Myxococcota bacterium]|jgi:CBS domain-containing protein
MKVPMARDLMTTEVFTLRPDLLATDAAGLLLRERISGAPVVTEQRRVIGIVSEADLMRALEVVRLGLVPTCTVHDVMTPDPLCAPPDATLYDLAQVFFDYPIRRLPIEEGGVLVGHVSRRDVLAKLVEVERELACAAAG